MLPLIRYSLFAFRTFRSCCGSFQESLECKNYIAMNKNHKSAKVSANATVWQKIKRINKTYKFVIRECANSIQMV